VGGGEVEQPPVRPVLVYVDRGVVQLAVAAPRTVDQARAGGRRQAVHPWVVSTPWNGSCRTRLPPSRR
jgi:hypothetical protein